MTIRKKNLPQLIAKLALGLACGGTAFAQSSDALLDKLVEKGVLTTKEANQLKEETDKDFTKAYSIKSGMPDWVQSLKLNGDFRGRFDEIRPDNGPGTFPASTRDRFRYRARFGATATLSDKLEVGLRLGSGEANSSFPSIGGNPLSGNTTMNNDGTRKLIFVDLAYAKWTPADWAEVQFGKMANAFWTDGIILDPDYNPEGAQEKLTWNLNDKNALRFTSGQWVIMENSTKADTFLFVNEIDWSAKWNSKLSSRVGLGMYNFANQSGITSDMETVLGGYNNGIPAVGANRQNFNPVFVRAEATYSLDSFPLYKGAFPITASGEYINNPAANGRLVNGLHQPYTGKQNEAYNMGITFGSSKNKGNWQVGYTYQTIETASVWRGLASDDFGYNGRGGANVRGHWVSASYKILNPLSLGVQYFLTEQIVNDAGQPKKSQDRLMVDFMLSF